MQHRLLQSWKHCILWQLPEFCAQAVTADKTHVCHCCFVDDVTNVCYPNPPCMTANPSLSNAKTACIKLSDSKNANMA
jgi:hypothetical protein